MDHLQSALAELEQAIAQIEASGPVAEKGTVIEVCLQSNGKHYARKRNGKKFKGCGRQGSDKHKEAIASVQRRAALEDLKELIRAIRALQNSEHWHG